MGNKKSAWHEWKHRRSLSLTWYTSRRSIKPSARRNNGAGYGFGPEPAPVPISESDNPDAIALRSAISVLQIQRQRALNDIRSLEKLKHQVNERPEEFVKQLEKDNLSKSDGDVLGLPATKRVKTEDMQEAVNVEKEVVFEKIPAPQNIVRCTKSSDVVPIPECQGNLDDLQNTTLLHLSGH
ncbi:hypothetical protein KEM55_001978 [Ascosphaera atra]|nr:hypothetical protein KEM55_001978 [Ascosphaera atra]